MFKSGFKPRTGYNGAYTISGYFILFLNKSFLKVTSNGILPKSTKTSKMTDQRQDIPEKKTLHWLNLPERLTEFAQETSIHGLSFVAQTSYSGFKRLTWFFLFLGSLMYAGLQLKTASEGYIVFHFVYLL